MYLGSVLLDNLQYCLQSPIVLFNGLISVLLLYYWAINSKGYLPNQLCSRNKPIYLSSAF